KSTPRGDGKSSSDIPPYYNNILVLSPTCYNTRIADTDTPERIQKEHEEGEVTPVKDEEDPDSGFTK
ncbi:hypothetical protein KI387_030064, partial [Taxus chinensis]